MNSHKIQDSQHISGPPPETCRGWGEAGVSTNNQSIPTPSEEWSELIDSIWNNGQAQESTTGLRVGTSNDIFDDIMLGADQDLQQSYLKPSPKVEIATYSR